METDILQYLNYKNEIKKRLKEWVKDESIPLDLRWEVFCKSDLGDTVCNVRYDFLKQIKKPCINLIHYINNEGSLLGKKEEAAKKEVLRKFNKFVYYDKYNFYL